MCSAVTIHKQGNIISSIFPSATALAEASLITDLIPQHNQHHWYLGDGQISEQHLVVDSLHTLKLKGMIYKMINKKTCLKGMFVKDMFML